MTVIRLGGFRGELPRIHPRLIPDGAAQVALNARMDSAALESMRAPLNLQPTTLVNPLSLYRYAANIWLEAYSDTDWVPYPVANDIYGRVIYADPDAAPPGLRVTDATLVGAGGIPSAYRNLDVPPPTQGFSATLVGIADVEDEVPETRYYVCTFVNSWGAEGPPSPPSNQVEWRTGQTVRLEGLPAVPSGAYDITYRRVYRLNTGSSGSTNYQFLTELAVIKAAFDIEGITQENPVVVETTTAHTLTAGQQAIFEGLGLELSLIVSAAQNDPATFRITDHGFFTGKRVTFTDVVSASQGTPDWEDLNGTTHTITVLDSDRFTIPVDSTVYSSQLVSGAVTQSIFSVAKGAGIAEDETRVRIPLHGFVDGQTVEIAGWVSSSGTDWETFNGERYVISYEDVDVFNLLGADSKDFQGLPTAGTVTVTHGMDELNGNSYAIQVVDATHFSLISVDGTGFYEYVDEGVVSQVSGNTFIDAIPSANLAEVIPTELYDPPNDATIGIKAHPSGFLAGFFGNTLAFSEPGAPHAWPIDYRLVTGHDIVGLGVFGNTIAIVTEGWPYLAIGSDPSAISMVELEIEQACVSKRGMVDFGTAIAYPSPDGLIVISGNGATNATAGIFNRDQWQALVPTSFVAMNWEQKYLCFYDDGAGVQRAFIIDPFAPEDGVKYVAQYATGGYKDIEEDILYLIISDEIERWNESTTNLQFTWKSRPVFTPHAVNMAAAKVIADDYPVTVEFYSDDVKRHTKIVQTLDAFRLPGGFKGEKFETIIKSTKRVSEVIMATTMSELSVTV